MSDGVNVQAEAGSEFCAVNAAQFVDVSDGVQRRVRFVYERVGVRKILAKVQMELAIGLLIRPFPLIFSLDTVLLLVEGRG